MTETEKDVGGWLYNEVNLYPLKECLFLACRGIKLHEELIFLVTDTDQCGRSMTKLTYEVLGLRYQGDAAKVFHVICFRRY